MESGFRKNKHKRWKTEAEKKTRGQLCAPLIRPQGKKGLKMVESP